MYNEKESNTLKAWAAGKFAMTVIGIAVGIFLYRQGIIQKITGKLFKKEEN